jgi:hypothetical protein
MKAITTISRTLIQPKRPDVLVSNILQLKEIEKYHRQHSNLTVDQAAIKWIARNSAQWRKHHLAI